MNKIKKIPCSICGRKIEINPYDPSDVWKVVISPDGRCMCTEHIVAKILVSLLAQCMYDKTYQNVELLCQFILFLEKYGALLRGIYEQILLKRVIDPVVTLFVWKMLNPHKTFFAITELEPTSNLTIEEIEDIIKSLSKVSLESKEITLLEKIRIGERMSRGRVIKYVIFRPSTFLTDLLKEVKRSQWTVDIAKVLLGLFDLISLVNPPKVAVEKLNITRRFIYIGLMFAWDVLHSVQEAYVCLSCNPLKPYVAFSFDELQEHYKVKHNSQLLSLSEHIHYEKCYVVQPRVFLGASAREIWNITKNTLGRFYATGVLFKAFRSNGQVIFVMHKAFLEPLRQVLKYMYSHKYIFFT